MDISINHYVKSGFWFDSTPLISSQSSKYSHNLVVSPPTNSEIIYIYIHIICSFLWRAPHKPSLSIVTGPGIPPSHNEHLHFFRGIFVTFSTRKVLEVSRLWPCQHLKPFWLQDTLPETNMTMEIHHLKMYSYWKWWFCQCHVSFQGCRPLERRFLLETIIFKGDLFVLGSVRGEGKAVLVIQKDAIINEYTIGILSNLSIR